MRGIGLVNGKRAAGENNSLWADGLNSRLREVVRLQFAEDVAFAETAGNEVAVLRTEVKDEDCFVVSGEGIFHVYAFGRGGEWEGDVASRATRWIHHDIGIQFHSRNCVGGSSLDASRRRLQLH